jgi:uncharacterized NAD(P)/FAD-binding protein YdhS
VGADGQPSRILYTLGPARKGHYWESIAVPDIRAHAVHLARHLLVDS